MSRDIPRPARPDLGPRALVDVGPIATLAQRAGKLDAVDRALRQVLPAALREQVRFANFRGDRLVFLASTPAWASRLRLQQNQVLAAARAIGAPAGAITVKVAPLPPPEPGPEPKKPLSMEAARHLQRAAPSVQDPELRALFMELASVAKPGNSGNPGKR